MKCWGACFINPPHAKLLKIQLVVKFLKSTIASDPKIIPQTTNGISTSFNDVTFLYS
jgi:hypothetical protein